MLFFAHNMRFTAPIEVMRSSERQDFFQRDRKLLRDPQHVSFLHNEILLELNSWNVSLIWKWWFSMIFQHCFSFQLFELAAASSWLAKGQSVFSCPQIHKVPLNSRPKWIDDFFHTHQVTSLLISKQTTSKSLAPDPSLSCAAQIMARLRKTKCDEDGRLGEGISLRR